MSLKGVTIPHMIQDYIVLETLGEGVFGKVFQCFNSKTSEVVALKVLKNQNHDDLEDEVDILRTVAKSDPCKHNIVKFIDVFSWDGYNCMAFEMLDCSLLDFMNKRKETMSLSEIRVITQQLLVAFDRLKKLQIVHTDLKLDNVMLVNQKKYPLRVKLIDFGLANHVSDLVLGTFVSPHSLKSPEVNLGLPLTEAIDMWSLGCSLLALYWGNFPFSGSSPYDNQRSIVNLLGYPPDDLLNRGIYSRHYYSQGKDGQWRLKSSDEYFFTTCKDPKITRTPFDYCDDLEDAILFSTSPANQSEMRDRISFLNLVKKLLNLDYEKRITPSEALQHPFITLQYFVDDNGEYAQRAQDFKKMVFGNTEEKPSNLNQDVKEMSPAQSQSSSVCAPRKCTFTQVSEGTKILTFHDSINNTNTSVKQEKSKDVKEMSPAQSQSSQVLAPRKCTFTQVSEGIQILKFHDSINNMDSSVKQEKSKDVKEMTPAQSQSRPVCAPRKCTFTQASEGTQILTFHDSINNTDTSVKQEKSKDVKEMSPAQSQSRPVCAPRKCTFNQASEGTQILKFHHSINNTDTSVKQEITKKSANAVYRPPVFTANAEQPEEMKVYSNKPDVVIDMGDFKHDLNKRQFDFTTTEEKAGTSTLICNPDNVAINTGDIDFGRVTNHTLEQRQLDFTFAKEKTDMPTLTTYSGDAVIDMGHIDSNVSNHKNNQRQFDSGDAVIDMGHIDSNVSNHKNNQRQFDSGDAVIDMGHIDSNVSNHKNNQREFDSGDVVIDMGDDQEETEDTNSRGVT